MTTQLFIVAAALVAFMIGTVVGRRLRRARR